MDDKKFDEIMKNWTKHEHESAPQLRPTKDLYQMVKAKKQNLLFPIFARWVTVGVAAAIIVVVAILHPGLVPLPPFQDKTPKQEELPGELLDVARQDMADEDAAHQDTEEQDTEAPKGATIEYRDKDVSGQSEPPMTAEKKDASQTRGRTLQEPEAPAEKIVEKAPAREGSQVEQFMAADQAVESIRVGEEMEPERQVAVDLTGERAPTGGVMDEQPQTEVKSPPPAAPMLKSRSVAETRKVKEEPSPGKGVSQLTTLSEEAEKEETPEPSAMRALSVGRTYLSEKRIGEKIFHLKGDVWIDSTYMPEQELLTIKRDSQAYHDLLTALPDLQKYVEAGEHVIVVFGDNALEIAEEGKSELTEEELEKLSEP